MENKIYEYAHSSIIELRVVNKTDNLNSKEIENDTNLFQLIMETVLDVKGDVIAHSKYYIPLNRANLKIYCNK